jgi:hypothetical protein
VEILVGRWGWEGGVRLKAFKMAMIRSHDPVDLHNPRASKPRVP